MKKLLLIEDSNLFAKAIARQLAVNNYFEVHHAASLAETLELLANNDYYVAIADLVLPDASSGEAVYKLISLDIPVIALTGTFNNPLQTTISSLPIVDYVVKESKNDIAYAVRLAELLLFTKDMKLMLAGGSTEERGQLASFLMPFRFNLIQADTAKSASEQFVAHNDIAILVCDEALDDGSGLELLSQVRKEKDELNLPVLFTLSEQGPSYDAKILKSGANDFVVKPFSREEIISRLVTQLANMMRYRKIQDYASIVDRYIISSSTDEFGIIRDVSQAFCQISGYERDELIGRSHNIVRHPEMKNALYKDMWQTISSGKSWTGEVKNRKKDGSFYWVDVHIDPHFDASGYITGYTAIRQDITDKKYIEELSVTDPMTGLYNRRHFNKAFSDIAENAERKKKKLAFLIFDVDHFKAYNDNYGHQAGDEVLIRIGEAISNFAGRQSAYAYRLGGEEFALLYQAANDDLAISLAESLRAAIEHLGITHSYNSAADVVTASFGLYIQSGGAEVTNTYKRGDALLYEAKESGRNKVVSDSSPA